MDFFADFCSSSLTLHIFKVTYFAFSVSSFCHIIRRSRRSRSRVTSFFPEILEYVSNGQTGCPGLNVLSMGLNQGVLY